MTQSRYVIAWGHGLGRELTTKEHKRTYEVMEIFCIMTAMGVHDFIHLPKLINYTLKIGK